MAPLLTLSLNQAKEALNRDGYALIPNVFENADTNLIRRRAYDAADRSGDRLQIHNGRVALLFWPKHVCQFLCYYAEHPRLKKIVRHMLGEHVRQINNQIYFRESGDGDQFAWHQDIIFRTPATDFVGVEEHYLQTIIVVDPMDVISGAIEFIPGSHAWGDMQLLKNESDPALRKFVRGNWSGTKVMANPGDVIIWNSMVIHGSEPNTSGRPRMTYMNGFAAEHAVLNKGKYPVYPT